MHTDNRNYYSDHRVRAANRSAWYDSIDPRTMTATVYVPTEDYDGFDEEPVTLHFIWAVCPTCQGNGTHVNPSIDCGGISAEQWDEWDEDDREGYHSGRYDVECYECRGARVVAEPTGTIPRAVEAHWRDLAAADAERRAELMAGC